MFRDIREERQVILAILALWLVIIAICAAAAWLTIGKAHAAKAKAQPKSDPTAQCAPIAPLMEKLKASGLEYEIITDGLTVLKIVAALKANTDAPFPMPSKLVIVFLGDEAKIGIVINEKLCAIITGPASAVRLLVHKVHGQTIRDDTI